jgi:PTS system nitrogen regulatory IIA component
MPREQLDAKQVAAYLNMDLREVRKLASRGQIPCRRVGGAFVFTKVEVDHWAFERFDQWHPHQLERIERGVAGHHGHDAEEMLICPLIPPEGLAVPLDARTGDAVLRKLVDLGVQIGRIYLPDEVLDELRQREQLCSTAMIPGVAMPHPRHPLPYDISESFVLVGLTHSGVPYGAEDGSLTRLFFLICCKDEQTHLHVLARLARMLHEKSAVEDFLGAQRPEQLQARLTACERSLLD